MSLSLPTPPPGTATLPPGPRPAAPAAGRSAAIDHLRIALTLLVILHHVAIVYGGSGSWYLQEASDASSLPLVLFNAVNQSFFMGFFFLLAGYFTPAAFDRKGATRYLADRALRLGLPLVGYLLVLSPLTIALARTSGGEPLLGAWAHALRTGDMEPGPLWFAEALLLFALGYACWRKARVARPQEVPLRLRHRHLLTAALALGFTSYALRLVFPVGDTVAGLQLGYFAPYVLLFAVGCAAAPRRQLETIDLRLVRPWLVLSILLIAALPLILLWRGEPATFTGGPTLNALIYALWDPLVAWGLILGLLWLAHRHLTRATTLSAWLARRAYGMFIVHPPVVVALTIACAGWQVPALVKFAAVGALSCLGSALVAAMVVTLPGLRRIL